MRSRPLAGRGDQGETKGMGLWARAVTISLVAGAVLAAASRPSPTRAAPYTSPAMSPAVTLPPTTLKVGSQIYHGVCSACHDQGVGRAPQLFMLKQMTPESIDLALTEGVMKGQGAGLGGSGRRMVAEWIAGRAMGARITPPLMCQAGTSAFDVQDPPVMTGWGLTPENSHAISTKVAGIDRANVSTLKLKWSLAFPNAIRARSQPAFAGGAIFVGSHDGTVFALDRATGCARWTFHAEAEVRTGIVVSPWKAGDGGAQPRLYFGDLIGKVYAVNARTGQLIWKDKPDSHPNATITAAPVLHGDRLYVAVSSLEEARALDPHYECCIFRGSVVAYDAATGKPVWQTFMTDPPTAQGVNSAGVKRLGPSGVALWNSPAIDAKRGRLYLATGDNYSAPPSNTSDSIVAMDLATGKIDWVYQAQGGDAWNVACGAPDKANCPEENGPDYDFGAGVVLATASDGRDYLLAGQKSGNLFAVDPDSGKLVWKTRVGRGGVVGGIHFGIATLGDTVFAPVNDGPDGRTYDIQARPGMYALDIKTGNYLWKSPATDVCGGKAFCHPGYAAPVTVTPDLVLAGSTDGHLRIFDSASGEVLWDYDTLRDFTGVNGAVAHGGSMGGGTAPIAYKGLLVANSGYGFAGAMAGNALLVFEAK